MTRDITNGDKITYVNTRASRGGAEEIPFQIRVRAVRDDGATIVVRKEYVDREGVSSYSERELDRSEFVPCSNCGRMMYYPTRDTNRYADECPGECHGGDDGC